MKINFIGCYITPRAKIYVSSAHGPRKRELAAALGIILMQRDGENTQTDRHTHKRQATFWSRPICTLNSSIFADEMMHRRIRKLQRFRTMPVSDKKSSGGNNGGSFANQWAQSPLPQPTAQEIAVVCSVALYFFTFDFFSLFKTKIVIYILY